MNQEIRFRVSSEHYRLAEEKAVAWFGYRQRGRHTAVSNLARAALLRTLGVPLPQELNCLPPMGSVMAEDTPIRLTVRFRVDPDYRKRRLLVDGVRLPSVACHEFAFSPGSVPDVLWPYLEVTAQGARGSVDLSGWEGSLAELRVREDQPSLDQALDILDRLEPPTPRPDAEDLEAGRGELESWARTEGSELLRARLEEGFEWLELARQEWALERVRQFGPWSGTLSSFDEPGRLGAENPSPHSLSPCHEPALEQIERLREIRRRLAGRAEVRLARLERRPAASDRVPRPGPRSGLLEKIPATPVSTFQTVAVFSLVTPDCQRSRVLLSL
ncbi:MAG: hypothetical protein HY319_27755 [Armatimonadetes bacterium]|nr:hypothetical protein [Armatimonadota bacterium]